MKIKEWILIILICFAVGYMSVQIGLLYQQTILIEGR